MNKELEKKLQTKYPQIFQDLYCDEKYTAMAWGLECGDGWYRILERLCEDIMAEGPPDNFKATQVKEKFGTLRFYCYGATKEIYEAIDRAEEASESTCENCGSTGAELRTDRGWLKTLCDGCYK